MKVYDVAADCAACGKRTKVRLTYTEGAVTEVWYQTCEHTLRRDPGQLEAKRHVNNGMGPYSGWTTIAEMEPHLAMMTQTSITGVGASLVLAERVRQMQVEGWTPGRDVAEYHKGELIAAAICYAQAPYPHQLTDNSRNSTRPEGWPWSDAWWKPGKQDANGNMPVDQRVRELAKAGALICAEIDRLQAQEAQKPKHIKAPLPAGVEDTPEVRERMQRIIENTGKE